MIASSPPAVVPFPSVLTDALKESVRATFTSICGAELLLEAEPSPALPAHCVVGILSFVGDLSWSLALMLPSDTAPALAGKFAGFDIPFDSPDMGDVVGELANVLGGDVVARLENRRIRSRMSLPTVTRGSEVELLHADASSVEQLWFRTAQGLIRIRLAAALPGKLTARMPGA